MRNKTRLQTRRTNCKDGIFSAIVVPQLLTRTNVYECVRARVIRNNYIRYEHGYNALRKLI